MTQQQANRYDAIVIGGGHNGLITAAYLAKHGARTVVLESRHKTGGAADTMSPWDEAPDIKVTTLSYVMSLMPPTIQKDLQLERFGYKVYPQGMGYLPTTDGSSIVQPDDEAKTRESIAAVLQERRRRLLRVRGLDRTHREHHGAAPHGDPAEPRLQEARRHQGRRAARLAAAQGDRPPDGGRHHAAVHDDATDLLDRWFESPVVKGFMAVNGIIGTWAGPDAPGTAYVLMRHSVGDIGDGQIATWGYPEGGMGAVCAACKTRRGSSALRIRMNASVRRSSPATDEPRRDPRRRRGAPRAHRRHRVPPKITFLDHLERTELPDGFVNDMEHWKTRSGTVKINLALAELPEFTADPGFDPQIARRRRSRSWTTTTTSSGRSRRRGSAKRDAPVQRHRDPDGLRQDARARGNARDEHVHAVGAPGVGRRGRSRSATSRPTPIA